MKKINSVLDERQEGELLKVERNGCWGAFWGLLAAIAVQMFMYPGSFSHIESCIFGSSGRRSYDPCFLPRLSAPPGSL